MNFNLRPSVKVLTPSQAIRFMVDAYPEHAHALPLANVVADAYAGTLGVNGGALLLPFPFPFSFSSSCSSFLSFPLPPPPPPPPPHNRFHVSST